jgi:hypothetical protein
MLQKTIGGKMIVQSCKSSFVDDLQDRQKIMSCFTFWSTSLRTGRPVGKLAVQSVEWPYSRQNGCGQLLATVLPSKYVETIQLNGFDTERTVG